MNTLKSNRRTIWRGLSLAVIGAGAMALASTAALAGECPADKRGVDVTKPASHAAKDVTDKVLASIELGQEKVALKDHKFRLRRLEIQPGGIVPWHSHAERPALIYIVAGEVIEYASNCAVPIVHKAGEVSVEPHGTAHWWTNAGKETVVLLSADILRDPNDKNM